MNLICFSIYECKYTQRHKVCSFVNFKQIEMDELLDCKSKLGWKSPLKQMAFALANILTTLIISKNLEIEIS